MDCDLGVGVGDGDGLGAQEHVETQPGQTGGNRVERLADTHPRFRVGPGGQPGDRRERFDGQRPHRSLFDTGQPTGGRSGRDAAPVNPPLSIGDVARFEIGVELGEGVELGDRGQERAAEPADVTFDPALLMSAGDARFTEERLEPVVRPQAR